ncbi:hypothetical protein Vafri_19824 [Volvox africanus]|uniref:Endoplasmic reticulum transmembrane protein n=1 Tax=Volvox africanus TaxID=51714 RepID=A0A8J4F905_9CHLO|nr:hypothetical protein Vafri_19824 [Volvox africanus]
MDTIFTLPLFILAVLQAFITVLHAIPGVGLPLSQTLRLLTQNTASRSVIYTLMGALALLSTSSLYELSKGADKVRSGTLRGEVMATVDYLRAQVSCALSLSNLLVLLLNLLLSSARCKLDRTVKNLSAMQRQVKGLQAEYERVTASADKTAAGAATSSLAGEEAAALKKMVDKLIAEKQQLEAAVEVAEAAAKTADARVTAMVAQVKGYDTEFDRLRDENTGLRQQLQRQQPGATATSTSGVAAMLVPNKKDD